MTLETTQTTTEAQQSVVLTDGAAAKVKALLEQEGRDDLRLRVAVQPGGCSGLRYQLFFDERSLDGDLVTDFDGVEVVVDRMSAPYLTGATIDFADRIDGRASPSTTPTRRAPAPAATRSTRPPRTSASRARSGPARGSLRVRRPVRRPGSAAAVLGRLAGSLPGAADVPLPTPEDRHADRRHRLDRRPTT